MEAARLERNYKLLAIVLVALATVIVLVYGFCVGSEGRRAGASVAALLTAGAPFALGGFFGFLFGIPRTLQQPEASNGGAAPHHRSAPNTNLEQVSDWLTKILIGVGLTQLTQVPAQIQAMGEYVAASLGPNAAASTAAAILVVFAIAGFTIGYLLTKFDLTRAIDHQDDVYDQLAASAMKNPGDRRAVEHMVYGALFRPEPDGFEAAIRESTAFLGREGHPHPEDADLLAYLTCALGQKYRFRRDHKADANELNELRDEVVRYAGEAIRRDPAWKMELRQLANPPAGSNDDDLAALKDDARLREVLGIT